MRRFTLFLVACLALVLCGCRGEHSAAALAASEVSKSPVPVRPDGNWTVSDPQVDQMDGLVRQFVETGAVVRVRLCFQDRKLCSVPAAIVAPEGCFIESNVDDRTYARRIRIKFDDGKAITEVWGISDSHHAVFPFNSGAFVRELGKHNVLRMEFGCADYDSSVTTFNVSGLQAALAGLKVHN